MTALFDPLAYRSPISRKCVYGARGMVATSQPLAAQVGLRILQEGGNAVDAAVATAAALTVLEPTCNGIGGDAFAIIWHQGRMYGLNASGPAPRALSAAHLRAAGLAEIPLIGWPAVTVPGAPASWAAAADRFGTLPLSALLEPAASYAQEGYPVSPVISRIWAGEWRRLHAALEPAAFAEWAQAFTCDGQAPRAGACWASPAHAATLRAIGASAARDFYAGDLAERMVRHAAATGGYLSREDLAEYQVEWVDPVPMAYRGYEVWELPPNSQGIIASMALGIAAGFPIASGDAVLDCHRRIEAIKLASSEGFARITDPRAMPEGWDDLLDDAHLAALRERIGAEASVAPAADRSRGTVYLATADRFGNMVSFIQSNYFEFGSGIVVPGTGIAFQNRGASFSLDPAHANVLAPGKRPFHTIIPAFLTHGGAPVGPFGIMGGRIQPQAHVQFIEQVVGRHVNPQAALDHPRWYWRDGVVEVEPGFDHGLADGLARRGHRIQATADALEFGRGQVIFRDEVSSALCGATESRTDGVVAAW